MLFSALLRSPRNRSMTKRRTGTSRKGETSSSITVNEFNTNEDIPQIMSNAREAHLDNEVGKPSRFPPSRQRGRSKSFLSEQSCRPSRECFPRPGRLAGPLRRRAAGLLMHSSEITAVLAVKLKQSLTRVQTPAESKQHRHRPQKRPLSNKKVGHQALGRAGRRVGLLG